MNLKEALNGVNSNNTHYFIHQVSAMGRHCFHITLFKSAVLSSVGGGRIGYASRRRDRERKEEKKRRGMREVSAPSLR